MITLKEAAISLRDTVASVIQKVEEHWNCDIAMAESEKNHVLKLYRETMLQAYNFGFEVSLLFLTRWRIGYSLLTG